MHHYECLAPNVVDIIFQSEQLWAMLIASFRERDSMIPGPAG